MLSRRLAVSLLVSAVASCRSPNPTLYTLVAVPGSAHAGAPRMIELRSIVLARYLERSQIVRSSENYQLDIIGNDWWGEPLDAMLGRVLVQELTDRLPGSTVFGENSAISAVPDATVGITVQRLDADAAGTLILLAQVSVAGRRTTARTVRLSVAAAVGRNARFGECNEHGHRSALRHRGGHADQAVIGGETQKQIRSSSRYRPLRPQRHKSALRARKVDFTDATTTPHRAPRAKRTLFRSEEPIARVAQARTNVAVLIQAAVNRCGDNGHVWMLRPKSP